MGFQKGHKKLGGKQKGTLNKYTEAQQDFIAAWQECSGPETAKQLILVAIAEAKDKRNFIPLTALLPYIARKMPQAIEATGKDAGPIEIYWYDAEKHP